MKKLQQLYAKETTAPKLSSKLTEQQKKEALKLIMFIKEKHTSEIKGCHCTNGRKRKHVSKEETAFHMVHLELDFISSLMDAKEGRESYYRPP